MWLLSKCVKPLFSVYSSDGYPAQEDEAEKRAFKRHLEPQIQLRGAAICLIGAILTSIALYDGLQKEALLSDSMYAPDFCPGGLNNTKVPPFAWTLDDPRFGYFMSQSIAVCVFSTFAICALLGSSRVCKRFQGIAFWETTFCLAVSLCLCLTPMAASRGLATMAHPSVTDEHRYQNRIVQCFWRVDVLGEVSNIGRYKSALAMDALITAICMYVPLGSTSSLCTCLSAITSWTLFAFFTGPVQWWLIDFLFLLSLCFFAWQGSVGQQRLQWRTWTSRSQLQERSAVTAAMETISKSFCDVVIPLTIDCRLHGSCNELRSVFGDVVDGSLFTDFLAADDVERFSSMIKGISGSRLPGCISVTMWRRGASHSTEANLFVARVMSSQYAYILGMSFPREQLLPEREHVTIMPLGEQIGKPLSAQSCSSSSGYDSKIPLIPAGGQKYRNSDTVSDRLSSSKDASNTASGVTTEKVFAAMDVDNLEELGRLEHWLLRSEAVEVDSGDVLGSGGYGVVYGGTFCGSQVAVKRAKAGSDIDIDDEMLYFGLFAVANELRILRCVRHPNIVLFHGAYISDDTLSLVLERVTGQSLSDFVQCQQRSPPQSWAQRLISGITSSIWYLHVFEPCIVHGDLKPTNILVEMRSVEPLDGNMPLPVPHAKLIDFGLSRMLSKHPKPLGGTRTWCAPEVYMNGNIPRPSADVFSLGCTLFFIVTKMPPFNVSLRSVSSSGEMPSLPWSECDSMSTQPSAATTGFRQLLEKCVRFNAADRPSALEVHKHTHGCLSKKKL